MALPPDPVTVPKGKERGYPRANQAREMAHLRPLDRCRGCGRPATEALYMGLNDLVAYFCGRCAPGALKDFKAGERP